MGIRQGLSKQPNMIFEESFLCNYIKITPYVNKFIFFGKGKGSYFLCTSK